MVLVEFTGNFTIWVILWDIGIDIRYYLILRENMSSFTNKLSILAVLTLLTSCGAADNSSRGGDTPPPRDNADDTAIKAEEVNARSQIFRNSGTKQISYLNEAKELTVTTNDRDEVTNTTYLGSMRDIPNMLQDIENNILAPAKPNILNCGVELEANIKPTVKLRFNHCKKINDYDENIYSWKGKAKGISGEGQWDLISKADNLKVWRDNTTGLLWSDKLSEKVTWKTASGADGKKVDRACQIKTSLVSALGKITAKEVYWRLPTRNDFLQADINGARFVLPNTDEVYWTANFKDSTSQEAWTIEQKTGILSTLDIATAMSVRCVGIVK